MAITAGLKNSLNRIRELSSDLYSQYVPMLEDDSDIAKLAEPILNVPEVYNEFCSALINRIVYTSVETRMFNNPLTDLQRNDMPLGYAAQDVYVNAAAGRQYDVNDFAGILTKYEADVKVQYLTKNLDVQYPVTIVRTKLKEAFVSWEALDQFINGLSTSLYNGMYIDEYAYTKSLVSSAYKGNNVKVQVVSNPAASEANAKAFIKEVRSLFTKFQSPSAEYNAWHQVGGAGKAVTTWAAPEDIIFMTTADIMAEVDVEVRSGAFSPKFVEFLTARTYIVDNFDVINRETGVKIYDGSKIYGLIADRSWFKIKKIDQFMEDQRNANNRSLQLYLNNIMMFEYSLFANAVIFASEAPAITATAIEFGTESVEIAAGDHEGLDVTVTPAQATTAIEYEVTEGTADDLVLTATDNGRHLDIKATSGASGDYTVTATAGSVSDTLTVTVA